MQQEVRNFVRNREPLADSRVSRVVSDRTAFAPNDQHSGDVFPQSASLHSQIQTPRHLIDGYRDPEGVGVTQCLLRLSFEVFSADVTSCPNVAFRVSSSVC